MNASLWGWFTSPLQNAWGLKFWSYIFSLNRADWCIFEALFPHINALKCAESAFMCVFLLICTVTSPPGNYQILLGNYPKGFLVSNTKQERGEETMFLFDTKTFIQMVRKHPCLYDPQDSHYKSRSSKIPWHLCDCQELDN